MGRALAFTHHLNKSEKVDLVSTLPQHIEKELKKSQTSSCECYRFSIGRASTERHEISLGEALRGSDLVLVGRLRNVLYGRKKALSTRTQAGESTEKDISYIVDHAGTWLR